MSGVVRDSTRIDFSAGKLAEIGKFVLAYLNCSDRLVSYPGKLTRLAARGRADLCTESLGKNGRENHMTQKTCLCFAIAAMLSLAAVSDAQAFFGSRGSWGGCGSSGGSYGGGWGGGWGSNGSGGSWGGSSGSHAGLLHRIFHRGHGSNGSNGGYSSHGSNGGYSSSGSAGGSAYSYDGGYYTSSRPVVAAPIVVAAPTPAVKTQLTLQVPAGAKVTLAGVPTKQTGEVRQFTTTKLAFGQAWENYQIVVEMERDGKVVREERTITLTGGQPQQLAFGGAMVNTLAQVTR
jgi:uncharacterized protein (TIGR03000 family)